jgi:hypothetical protein
MNTLTKIDRSKPRQVTAVKKLNAHVKPVYSQIGAKNKKTSKPSDGNVHISFEVDTVYFDPDCMDDQPPVYEYTMSIQNFYDKSGYQVNMTCNESGEVALTKMTTCHNLDVVVTDMVEEISCW